MTVEQQRWKRFRVLFLRHIPQDEALPILPDGPLWPGRSLVHGLSRRSREVSQGLRIGAMGSAASAGRSASSLERSRKAAMMAKIKGGRKAFEAGRRLRQEMDLVVPSTPPPLPSTTPPEPVLTLKAPSRRRRKFEVQLPGCPEDIEEDIDSDFLEEEHV